MVEMTVGLVGTYPPTRCGIATFTASLDEALRAIPGTATRVVRLIDPLEDRDNEEPCSASSHLHHLVNGSPSSTRNAVRELERSCDGVIVQHEFGIYGGPDGSEVLDLLEQLTIPVTLVLHTVLTEPTDTQRDIIERASAHARHVVVMSKSAAATLSDHYRVDPTRVVVIPHGAFTRPTPDRGPRRGRRYTLLTWGLIGPGKGIEWAIMALALLRDTAPTLQYRIVGQTHPRVVRDSGEEYRRMLHRLTEDLQVVDQVHFVNRYLDRHDLSAELRRADLVVLPYDSRIQSTSGVLAETVAAAVPVVATGFPYARELVTPGRGWLVDQEDPRGLAEAIAAAMTREAAPTLPQWSTGQSEEPVDWPSVAHAYRRLAVSPAVARSA